MSQVHRTSPQATVMTLLGIIAVLPIGSRMASAQAPAGQPAPISEDAAIFSAVVRALGPAYGSFLRIDPRPLATDPTILQATPDKLAEVPPEVVRRRSEVLGRLGVRTIDYFSIPDCPGVLVPPPRDDSGCPRQGQYKAVLIGLPRYGGAYAPGYVDRREEGERAVRVIELLVGPGGSAWTISDFVLRRTSDGAWEVVDKVGILAVD